MMIGPRCPDHDDLALDLAQGRLGDDAAALAEDAVGGCRVCSGWWRDHLESDTAAVVDAAVASVFLGLELPARRRARGWMAAAAVLIMAVGVMTLWLTVGRDVSEPVVASRSSTIQSLDFEVPGAVPETVTVERTGREIQPVQVAEVVEQAPAEAPEIQTARSDEIRVAEVAPAVDPAEQEAAEPLFAGDFETGDLAAWVPTT